MAQPDCDVPRTSHMFPICKQNTTLQTRARLKRSAIVIWERLSRDYRFDRSACHRGDCRCIQCWYTISTVVFLVLYLYLSCYVFLPLSCCEKPITSGGDLFSRHVSDSISWLRDAMPRAKQEPRCEQRGLCLSGGRRILTFEYCFYCNSARQEKWQRLTNGGRAVGARVDSPPQCTEQRTWMSPAVNYMSVSFPCARRKLIYNIVFAAFRQFTQNLTQEREDFLFPFWDKKEFAVGASALCEWHHAIRRRDA